MDNLNNNNIIDESQGYAIISKESVRLMSESIGVSRLDDPVCLLLAEDVSYRLRELLHNATHYMRLCRRKKLVDQDIQKALEMSDNEPLLGHGTRAQDATFYQFKEEEFCFVDDKEVNLVEFALNPVTSLQPIEEQSIKKQWLFTEGQPLPTELITKSSKAIQSADQSALFQHYVVLIFESILGNDEELQKAALQDLEVNTKLGAILPVLLSIFHQGIRAVSSNVSLVSKLLYAIKAVITNRSLFLCCHVYAEVIVSSLFYCLTEPLSVSLNGWNDHWTVRQLAARLLARFVTLCDHSVPDIRDRLLRNVSSQLQARSTPLYCRYGLVHWLMCCGCRSVEDVLIADVDAVWSDLDQLLTAESTKEQEMLLSRNASLAADAIRCAFVLWIRARWFRDEFPVTIDLYHFLMDKYGESLLVGLNFMATYQAPARKNGRSSSMSSSKPILAMSHIISDEEVNQFLTHVPTDELLTSMAGDHHRSPGAESDRSCERVHRSDSESSPFGGGFDVTVRSTISATGIKLTIAKRRRGSDGSKKRRKRSRRSESRNDIDSVEAAFTHWKPISPSQPIVIRLRSTSKEQRKPRKTAGRRPPVEQPVTSTFSRLFSASIRQGSSSFRKIAPSRPIASAVKGSSALFVYYTL